MKENFEVGMKVGKPVFKQMQMKGKAKYVASECPLAGEHLLQAQATLSDDEQVPEHAPHPIELFAKAFGFSG